VVHQIVERACCRLGKKPVAERGEVGVRVDRHDPMVAVFGQVEREQRRNRGPANLASERQDGHRVRGDDRAARDRSRA
jgi:hypothetical protein